MIHIGTVYLFGTIYESHEFMPSFLKSLFSTTTQNTLVYSIQRYRHTCAFCYTFHGIISLNNILNARAHTNTFLAKQIHKFCVLSCHKFFLSSNTKKKKKTKAAAKLPPFVLCATTNRHIAIESTTTSTQCPSN